MQLEFHENGKNREIFRFRGFVSQQDIDDQKCGG